MLVFELCSTMNPIITESHLRAALARRAGYMILVVSCAWAVLGGPNVFQLCRLLNGADLDPTDAERIARCLFVCGGISAFVLSISLIPSRKSLRLQNNHTNRLTIACILCLLLFVVDYLCSRIATGPYLRRYWFFLPLCCALLGVLTLDGKSTSTLVEVIALTLALQCGYAVIAYATGIEQFHTPYFGNRACGTFENPNSLYPVALFGFGLGVGMVFAAQDSPTRWMFGLIALLGAAATILTFTRSASLALAATVFWLTRSDLLTMNLYTPSEPNRKAWRLTLIAVTVVLLIATAFVRTRGRLAGHAEDRSFWGRVAIWQTAWRIFRDRPLLGHGFATYTDLQYNPRFLTADLLRYNPRNSEAKNLLLNLACEFGLVGLAVWGWLAWAYVRLYRYGLTSLLPGSPERALLTGIHMCFVGLFVAGLFDTPLLTRGREAATLLFFVCLAMVCRLVAREERPALQHQPTAGPI